MTKTCLTCGEEFHRRRYPSGDLERACVWEAREYCSVKCGGHAPKRGRPRKWRKHHSLKPEAIVQRAGIDTSEIDPIKLAHGVAALCDCRADGTAALWAVIQELRAIGQARQEAKRANG